VSVTRAILYKLATSERFERLIHNNRTLDRRAFRAALRYVAGLTLADALAVVRDLNGRGFASSLDLFGETAHEPVEIAHTVQAYVDAANSLAQMDADVDLEVVPSHLGVDGDPDAFRSNLEAICRALPPGRRLQVSAEESSRTEAILDAVVRLRTSGAPVVATLQANLRRTEGDVERLADASVPIRLVKGAYLEPRETAFAWGEPTDLAFVRLAHKAHDLGIELAIGTHDRVLREALLLALGGIGLEMLLGVRREDAENLITRGYRVRIYVPYGEAWFRYWMRRLAESRGA
jgi:proline dehydrogenase